MLVCHKHEVNHPWPLGFNLRSSVETSSLQSEKLNLYSRQPHSLSTSPHHLELDKQINIEVGISICQSITTRSVDNWVILRTIRDGNWWSLSSLIEEMCMFLLKEKQIILSMAGSMFWCNRQLRQSSITNIRIGVLSIKSTESFPQWNGDLGKSG